MFYRVQRACDQVSETSRKQLREEMTLEFDTERSALIAKYEKERNSLRSVLFEKKKQIWGQFSNNPEYWDSWVRLDFNGQSHYYSHVESVSLPNHNFPGQA